MESIIHMLGEVEMGVQWTTGLIRIIKVVAWNVRWEWEFIACVFFHIRQWCLENVNLGEDFLFSKPVLCFQSTPTFPQHAYSRISINVLHCKYEFTGEISRSVYKAFPCLSRHQWGSLLDAKAGKHLSPYLVLFANKFFNHLLSSCCLLGPLSCYNIWSSM